MNHKTIDIWNKPTDITDCSSRKTCATIHHTDNTSTIKQNNYFGIVQSRSLVCYFYKDCVTTTANKSASWMLEMVCWSGPVSFKDSNVGLWQLHLLSRLRNAEKILHLKNSYILKADGDVYYKVDLNYIRSLVEW